MAKCYSDWPPIPPLHPSRRTPPQSHASPHAIRRQLASFVLHCSRSCASPLLEPKNLPDEFPPAVPAPAPLLDAAPKLGISNKFIRGLCGDPQTEQLAFECYRRALLQPGFLPEKKTANALTVQLLRAKQWSSLELLVGDFRAYGVLPEKRTCARLVACCIRARRFALADAVLGVLLEAKKGGAPAATAFAAAMLAYNKLHMYRNTVLLYGQARVARLALNADAYRAAMAACGALGEPDMVASLFSLYRSQKWYPTDTSPETYAIVCDAFGKAGRAMDALRCLREMEADGLSPNAAIYSSVVGALADAREKAAAEDLYHEAWDNKMLGDPDMFLKLAVMHVEAGVVEETVEVAKDMRQIGLRVTDCILSTIINGFVKRRGLKPAIRAYDKLVFIGCEPGQVTYAMVINVYCRLGRSDRAEAVFSEMVGRGFDKCVVAYGSMVSMYGKIRRASEAMKMLAMMKQKGCEPNVFVYNSLLDMHGRLGNAKQAEKLWKEMARRKVRPDRISYTAIILANNRAGELERCMELYEEFRGTGTKVDKAMAGLMAGVFSKRSRFNELIELLKDMNGTKLDRRLYMSVLRSLRDAGLEVHVKWLQSNFTFVEEKT
ncbi:unnamed protein product [Urochloa decumbens]|uniref:Pentatricopeptide repeat-containing protein n=1 Tax=Urochloa decumbens TaxID=240449 RepID=A0ABC9F5P4_9POAL